MGDIDRRHAGVKMPIDRPIRNTAELSFVTIGWVVFLQVGLVAHERLRYDAALSPAKWAAVVLILLLQAYLVLTPASGGSEMAAEPTLIPVTAETHAGDGHP